MIDLVPNHTSDQHSWFKEALSEGPGSDARERYWFRPGRGVSGELPPTDWVSVFGGPAWSRVADGEWYLHLFAPSQPDLHWDNQGVRDEFEEILRFWLDRGVAGFRVDVAHGLVKDPQLPDWQFHWEMVTGQEEQDVPPPPMWDQDDVHEIFRSWRRILDEYGAMMCAEAWMSDDERRSRYERPNEFHQCFNFSFLAAPWTALGLSRAIADSLGVNSSVGAPTTWVLSNHDVVRLVSRLGLAETGKGPNGIFAHDPQPDLALGTRRARTAHLLMLALPGSAYLYNGDELGLPEHTALPDAVRQDPTFIRTGGREAGRDGCRIPLPWRAREAGAGFSPDGSSWLPLPNGWEAYAVDQQIDDPASYLSLVRDALRYRKLFHLGMSELVDFSTETDKILDYRIGSLRVITCFNDEAPVPEGWRVLLSSSPVSATLGVNTTCWLTSVR